MISMSHFYVSLLKINPRNPFSFCAENRLLSTFCVINFSFYLTILNTPFLYMHQSYLKTLFQNRKQAFRHLRLLENVIFIIGDDQNVFVMPI
jgi:hypothetical protein